MPLSGQNWSAVPVCGTPSQQSVLAPLREYKRSLYFKETGIYPHYRSHPVSSAELCTKYRVSTVESRRNSLDMMFLHQRFCLSLLLVSGGMLTCHNSSGEHWLLKDIWERIIVKQNDFLIIMDVYTVVQTEERCLWWLHVAHCTVCPAAVVQLLVWFLAEV
jgi:hypothetical protein